MNKLKIAFLISVLFLVSGCCVLFVPPDRTQFNSHLFFWSPRELIPDEIFENLSSISFTVFIDGKSLGDTFVIDEEAGGDIHLKIIKRGLDEKRIVIPEGWHSVALKMNWESRNDSLSVRFADKEQWRNDTLEPKDCEISNLFSKSSYSTRYAVLFSLTPCE